MSVFSVSVLMHGGLFCLVCETIVLCLLAHRFPVILLVVVWHWGVYPFRVLVFVVSLLL